MIKLPAFDDMSVQDKILTMEALWDDLRERAGFDASPQWHREILAEREAAVEQGEDRFVDWEVAKSNISKEIG